MFFHHSRLFNILCCYGLCCIQEILASSCSTLIPSPAVFCTNAVDYPFFVPDGVTLAQLNAQAINLTSNVMGLLPADCQMNIKKMICSNVYHKCVPNINLTDTNTYNPTIYPGSMNLPFQRPCLSVCSILSQVGNTCNYLPNLLGFGQNCTAVVDYSGGLLPTNTSSVLQYDPSNNNSQCNDMSSTTFLVAEGREAYIHASDELGACSGIVTELYVPPANKVNVALAPMQAPRVVQTLIENALATNFAALPPYLSSDCLFALRKYFCSTSMLKPIPYILRDVISDNLLAAGRNPAVIPTIINSLGIPPPALSDQFYLYAYPAQQICLDYANKCVSFLAVANKSSLTPRCSAVDSSGAANYPIANQTIQSFVIPGSTPLTLQVNSSPNSLDSAMINSYVPKCPTGYVIPDDPTDKDINWVTGSACAVSCKAPVWTSAEWTILSNTAIVVPWVSLFCVLTFLVVWCGNPSKRKTDYPVIFFAITSGILTAFFCIMRCNSFETQFCRNNAVNYKNVDGFAWCSAQSVMIWYFVLASAITIICVSIDMFLKIVIQLNQPPSILFYLYLVNIFGLPWISIIYVLSTQDYGYFSASHLCLGASGDVDFSYFWHPLEVFTIIDILIIIPTIITAFVKRPKIDYGPIIFVLFIFPCQLSVILARYSSANSKQPSIDSLKTFTICVFKNFKGTDESWQAICGNHPETRPSFNNLNWVYACVMGLPLFLFAAYLVNPEFYRVIRGKTVTAYKVTPLEDNEKP